MLRVGEVREVEGSQLLGCQHNGRLQFSKVALSNLVTQQGASGSGRELWNSALVEQKEEKLWELRS